MEAAPAQPILSIIIRDDCGQIAKDGLTPGRAEAIAEFA
jgi:hypothetical protein